MKNKLFLLSEEEYLDNQKYIQNDVSWWLRTAGIYYHGYTVYYVRSDDNVCFDFAYSGYHGVRPAFRFKFDIYKDKPIGSVVTFGRIDWIKLKNNIYLSKDIVFNYHFDNKLNDYNTSDIKKKLKECELWWFADEDLKILKDFEEVE